MRRAFDVVGSRVMDIHTGEWIGTISDLLFDREGCLQGLFLEKKHWFEKLPFLPIDQIDSIGEDWVTVSGETKLAEDEKRCSEWFQLSKGEQRMVGLPVVTSNGKQLGILEDVYFEEKMGNIIGYELSDGFFNDLMEGRRVIRQPNQVLFGKDAFVIQEGLSDDSLHTSVTEGDVQEE